MPALEALEPLRRFRDENGRELLDLPRAPLPPAEAPAPVRFLPKWDNLLLAFADRRRVISDEHRREVVGKNGDVAATFLVDGFVAGIWRTEAGRVRVEPFAPCRASGAARSRRGGPTGGLAALMQIGAHISSAGGIHKAIDRAGDRRRVGPGLHPEPAHVAADEPRPGELRALQRAPGRGRDRRRPLPRALPLQPRDADDDVYEKSVAAMRNTIEVACAIDADGVVFHVGSHLGAGFEAGLERVLPALEQVLELCTDKTWLLMENSAGAGGTIGRSIEELATLLRADGRASPARHLPRLLPPLGVRLRRDRPGRARRCSTRSTRAIGLDRLRALHVNDAAAPLGSNRDRHANILEGELGEQLGVFLSHPRLQGLPAVLEMPGKDGHGPGRGGIREAEGALRALGKTA